MARVEVMLPMVAVPERTRAARAHLDEGFGASETRAFGRRPELGIMVEVARRRDCTWNHSTRTFFSIGSNDLTQYVMAAARDSDAVAALNDP